jgi:hypothetical protein
MLTVSTMLTGNGLVGFLHDPSLLVYGRAGEHPECWVRVNWVLSRLFECVRAGTILVALDCCREQHGEAPDEPLDDRAASLHQ